jgi:glycosyltransferase involved in cell wall biosynthesis
VVSFTDVTNVTTLFASRDAPWDVVVCERTEPRQHNIGRAWSRLRQRAYGRARAIVVQTEDVRSWALAQGWDVPVYAIPNAAPVAGDAANPAELAEPAEHWDRPAVLALGRLSPEKGMDMLVEAFASIAGVYGQWRLRIFGEGTQRNELESLSQRQGISEQLQLPGWTNQPLSVLRAGDVFVLPSRYEGFPNALLEAMASGLACIAFDCRSGPREIIRDGVDGLLVPAGDVRALAAAMSRLMSDADLRGRLGQRALEVTTRFSRAQFYERWDAVLQGLPPGP